jgi:hypothetical protein
LEKNINIEPSFTAPGPPSDVAHSLPFLRRQHVPALDAWSQQAVQKSNEFVFTRSHQALRFQLAPFRNRAQIIVTAKVTFSNNFAPVYILNYG